jgi:Uma2 family endonuclease
MTSLSTTHRWVSTKSASSRVSDGVCLRVPRSAFTLRGFRTWVTSDDFPENLRVSFLNSEVYVDMSKEELEYHAAVKAEICRVLMNLIRTLMLGKFYLDGVLIANERAGVANNPDATFVSWASLEKGRVHLVPRSGAQGQYVEIEGTPDWVLEIVSDSSVDKDTRLLRTAYHRAGIPEYWLVDARGPEILFQILQRRKNAYTAVPKRDGWERSPIFGRDFRLVRETARLGLWEYTLQMRPD